MTLSHTAAFRAQADFAPEAKIVVGHTVWSDGVAGARLYAEVLSQASGTVGKAIALASELKPPYSDKAVMGHLRWMYTGGELTVDGKSYDVPVKAPKPAKVEAPKAEVKPEPKPEAKPEVKPEPKPEAKSARKPRFSGKRKAA